MKIIKIALAAAILGSNGSVVDARIGNAVDDNTSSSSTFDTATDDLVDEDDIEHRLLQAADISGLNPSVQYSDLAVKWARLSERYVLLAPQFGVCLIHYCFCGLVLLCSRPLFSYTIHSIISISFISTVGRPSQDTLCFMSRQHYSIHGQPTVMVLLVSSLILMVSIFVIQQPDYLIIGKGWHVCMPCVSYEYIYSFGLMSMFYNSHQYPPQHSQLTYFISYR